VHPGASSSEIFFFLRHADHGAAHSRCATPGPEVSRESAEGAVERSCQDVQHGVDSIGDWTSLIEDGPARPKTENSIPFGYLRRTMFPFLA
jgi:hypothetical protein